VKNKKLLVISGSVCLLLVLAALPFISACAKAPQTAGPPLTTKGYSIFDGTMADMTWPDVEKAAKSGAIVIVQIGTVEQHGPHMAQGTDTYMGQVVAKLVKQSLESKGIQTLIVPPFYFGMSGYKGAFPGTFSSRPETVKAVLYDIVDSLKVSGFNNVFVFSWHQEPQHNTAVLEGTKEARSGTGTKTYFVLPPWSGLAPRLGITGKEEHIIIVPPPPPPAGPPPQFRDVHAGKGETGDMAAFFPDLIDEAMAKTLQPNQKTGADLAKWPRDPVEMRKFQPNGYIGDPASFDVEAEKKDVEDWVKRMADTIESVVKGTYKPPEIK